MGTSKEEMVYFMVLAKTKWKVEDDDMEGEADEDMGDYSEGPAEENSEDEIEDNAEGEIGVETEEGEKETGKTYDDVGIILEPRLKQNHFYHIEALEFTRLSSSVSEAIQHREESDILGGCGKDGKYKIWLN
ncbi:hypothetical protein SLS56_008913 [Neofusicoccum ribis]|uniref:Uncharacterized protein n=1 Tax=Neofusicoccum ribis TaxID=45134 RepID=A0ABR3SJC8_9PEZI